MHTPWRLFRMSSCHHWKVDTGNPLFVDCGFDDDVAHLVVASPLLLEACEAVDAYLSASPPLNMPLKRIAALKVEQAIAAAKGEGNV